MVGQENVHNVEIALQTRLYDQKVILGERIVNYLKFFDDPMLMDITEYLFLSYFYYVIHTGPEIVPDANKSPGLMLHPVMV